MTRTAGAGPGTIRAAILRPVALSAGAQLGAYEIRGLVGSGGMGEVYRAFDPRLAREVAIKVVADDLSGDLARRERFRREAHAIASLSHPHIVTVHSAEDIDGHLVLVMELVDGKTLADLIPAGGMPLTRLVKIAVQMADALGAAHDRGIVHRDLKPRNVMVTTDGRVKVLDFGLAKLREARQGSDDALGQVTASLHALTAEGRIVGTAAYMSPEQAEGRRLDHRSDLFSTGIVLYELATGERPFTGESVVSVLSSILRDAPRPLAEINPRLPREFTRIVRRCLAKDPDERYQSAKDLRLDLEDLRQELGSSDQLPAVAGPRDASRASLLPFVGVGAVALALGGVAATTLLPRGGTRGSGVALVSAERLTVEPGPEGSPSISPDGQWVLYTRSTGGLTHIFLQAVGGERPLNLTAESGAGNSQPAFSADGNRIAFRSTRGGGGLYVMGRTGELVRQITDQGNWPAWSPDGTRLAYGSEFTVDIPFTYAGGSSIWTVDIASGRRTRLTDLDGTQPSWSPHDRRIAFWGVDPATQHRDIWTVPVGGGSGVRVTNDAAIDATPVWSSDGRHLYFSSDRGGTTNLWRVAIDEASGATTGPFEPVIVPTQNALHPAISRDGRRIAYMASSWSSDVYAFPFDLERGAIAGPPRWMFGGPHHWQSVRVSPDGRRIFSVRASQRRDLVLASVEGGSAQRLTDDHLGVRCPEWSPDGRTIVALPTRRGDKDVLFIEPDSGRTRRVSDVPSSGLLGCPAWSPDGKRLSLTQGPADPVVLIIDPTRPLAEQQVERLPAHPRGAFFPRAWSPDSTRLAGTIGTTLVLYDRRTSAYTIVAEPTVVTSASIIEWLPDGRRLIATAGTRTIVLVDTVSQEVQQVFSSAPDVLRSVSLSVPRRELIVSRGPDEADVWIATIQSQ